jgi:predicted transcriptional regulator
MSTASGGGSRVVGLSTAVVNLLESYRRALPIDFIASVLSVSSTEIVREVKTLEERGVVHRNKQDEVDLIKQDPRL